MRVSPGTRMPAVGQQQRAGLGQAQQRQQLPAVRLTSGPGTLAGTKPVGLRCMPIKCVGSSLCASRMADMSRFSADGGLHAQRLDGGLQQMHS